MCMIRHWLVALALAALASACGGGGGGGAPINRPPTFGALSFAVSEDSDLTAQLTASDTENDTLIFARASDPALGTVVNFAANGAFLYRPNRDLSGNDSFGVRVTDAVGNATNGTVTITITPVNDAPLAANDVMRADGAALTRVGVLANDRDVDGDALTVTLEQPAVIGTATVNADRSVRLDGLPAGFKGLTRFRYRIADPSGASATATVAVFVGADPFRVAFAGDASAAGTPEVYMTDFVVSSAWRVTAATEGALRLRGFVASENGATIVYRREDPASGASDLSFVRTAAADRQVRLALPAGHAPAADSSGGDQYVVSRDGQWIAAVTRNAADGRLALQLLNVGEPALLRSVAPAGTAFVALPRFSNDGQHLYFLAADVPGGLAKSLYRLSVGSTAAATKLSIPSALASDDVTEYSVAPDQSRIALQAVRGGRTGLYFIDPGVPQTEQRISHALAAGESIVGSTVGAPAGRGGSTRVERVAYTVLQGLQSANVYVADVAASPNPRLVASLGARAIGFRADDGALLYSKFSSPNSEQIFEAALGLTSPHTLVGGGASAYYDSSGEVVILEQYAGASASPTFVAAAARGTFGTTRQMGTPGLAAWFVDPSGADRAVVLLGEGPPGSTRPTSARLALVNAWAPETLIYLDAFQTPLSLTAAPARVVTY